VTVAVPRTLLPPEAYYSAEWYERERHRLFGRVWNFVGPESDVPADGAPLLVGAGPHLMAVERTAGGFVATRHDGRRGAADTWAGFLFVHPAPELGPGLSAWLGDLPAHIGAFRPERLVEVTREQFHVHANWKLYVENHIDVYHLWYLHEQSLATYDHPRSRWHDCRPHWAFYEPPRPAIEARPQHGLDLISHVGPDDHGSGAHLAFPNLPFASGASFFMTYQCIPHGPEHTVVDLRVRAEPGSRPDTSAVLAMFAQVLHDEDGAACEGVQAALRSPAFAVGPLAATHERPITLFHERLLETMA
jgi:phenylpropionate dioxygenase-like ring-hydroxylating dioxygenase large terminal subunit